MFGQQTRPVQIVMEARNDPRLHRHHDQRVPILRVARSVGSVADAATACATATGAGRRAGAGRRRLLLPRDTGAGYDGGICASLILHLDGTPSKCEN